jgi:hypothetical protein
VNAEWNWRYRSRWRPYFNFRDSVDEETYYESLMKSWGYLLRLYPGWGLEEVKSLSPRERKNWLEMSLLLINT